jgi:hypothetical protein
LLRETPRRTKRLIDELHAGQKTVVATIAASIAPYLGIGVSQMLSAMVAVAITLISEIGLRAWCVMQSERRRRAREKGIVPD